MLSVHSTRAASLSRDIDLNTSTTGLCRTSSSPNETVTNSYDVTGTNNNNNNVVVAVPNNNVVTNKGKKVKGNNAANNKRFKLKKKPKKSNGKLLKF